MTLVAEAELDLKKLGLTHAKGKNDKCDGRHTAEVEIDDPVDLDGLERALQKLHELVHPRGTLSVFYCMNPGCRDALNAINVEGYS
jgi:hypothetical protein